MTLTPSGYKCDVCGIYILGLTEDEVHPVKLTILDEQIDACKTCIEIIKDISGGDWHDLPEGPLKEVFKEAEKRQ